LISEGNLTPNAAKRYIRGTRFVRQIMAVCSHTHMRGDVCEAKPHSSHLGWCWRATPIFLKERANGIGNLIRAIPGASDLDDLEALLDMAAVVDRSAMLGQYDGPPTETAILGADLAANDEREDYLRATLSTDDAGRPVATPFAKQDSSMLSRLAAADALIVRPPHAVPAAAGDDVAIIPLSKDLAVI